MISFLRELYMYPGRLENHDYKAYRLQNTSIEGDEYIPVVNNIIFRLIQESNPKELRIHPYLGDKSIWNNLKNMKDSYNKYIPQMHLNKTINNSEEFCSLIKEVYENIMDTINKHKLGDKSIVYIIEASFDFTDEQRQELSKMISYIYTYGSVNGYYIMFVGRDIDDIIKTDIALKISTSKGENNDSCKQGIANIVSSDSSSSVYIPFYPDTFLTKFMRYYSVFCKE